MGVQGLLPLLKEIATAVHVREYAGQTVAIDASSWLYKGAYGCAMALAEGKDTDSYVTYCLRRLAVFREFGVKPYFVFDGAALPMKEAETASRRRQKKEKLKLAREHLDNGRRRQAEEAFQTCIEVTFEMAHKLILALRQMDIDYVVAPYEADAQLAYLAINGFADAVVTEDSDLLVFGAPLVLYKLDMSGHARQIRLRDLGKVVVSKTKKGKEIGLKGWEHGEFQDMCILGGCDYLPKGVEGAHIKGLGLKEAFRVLMKTSKQAVRAIRFLQRKSAKKVPKDYHLEVDKAKKTFVHQTVFCPRRKQTVPLHPYPDGEENKPLDYAGPMLPDATAVQLARGTIHPRTHAAMGDSRLSGRTRAVIAQVTKGVVLTQTEERQTWQRHQQRTGRTSQAAGSNPGRLPARRGFERNATARRGDGRDRGRGKAKGRGKERRPSNQPSMEDIFSRFAANPAPQRPRPSPSRATPDRRKNPFGVADPQDERLLAAAAAGSAAIDDGVDDIEVFSSSDEDDTGHYGGDSGTASALWTGGLRDDQDSQVLEEPDSDPFRERPSDEEALVDTQDFMLLSDSDVEEVEDEQPAAGAAATWTAPARNSRAPGPAPPSRLKRVESASAVAPASSASPWASPSTQAPRTAGSPTRMAASEKRKRAAEAYLQREGKAYPEHLPVSRLPSPRKSPSPRKRRRGAGGLQAALGSAALPTGSALNLSCPTSPSRSHLKLPSPPRVSRSEARTLGKALHSENERVRSRASHASSQPKKSAAAAKKPTGKKRRSGAASAPTTLHPNQRTLHHFVAMTPRPSRPTAPEETPPTLDSKKADAASIRRLHIPFAASDDDDDGDGDLGTLIL